MPHSSSAAFAKLAGALTHSVHALGEVLTRPPEPEEVPAYCRKFLPKLEVSYVIRADKRAIHEVPLERLSNDHGGVILDPHVRADGVHYRATIACPWVGPFPDYSAAYEAIWTREVCG